VALTFIFAQFMKKTSERFIMPKPLTITYVSHACIRLEGQFGSLLTDPWILNEPIYAFTTWKFPAAILPPEQLVRDLNYIYISHPHEDHLHIPSLDHFPRHITMLLPEYTSHPGLRAQTVERTLREMGFYNIHKIRPWETTLLGSSTPFTLIPAGKMKYWDWENSGFVLEHHDGKILNMNDCPSDPELYAELDKRFGVIDLGFIQYSGVSMFPGCYRMPKEEMKTASDQRKIGWIQQRNMIELLRVRKIAPFAGDFAWLDPRMEHYNWSNRSTPQLFSDFVAASYPEKQIDVVIMYPSDTWTVKGGLVRNHSEIDWDRYLDAIAKVQEKFAPKVTAIREWIEASSRKDLKRRSIAYTDNLNRWMTRNYVDFSARVRVFVEGEHSNFSFVMHAAPETGFLFDWQDQGDVDQELYIREALWAAVLEAKVLLTNIQWNAENRQWVPFRPEIARFWFWFENHVDLNNRNVQALIDRALHPELSERIRPQFGVFPIADEWDASWLADTPARRVN
jgi:L-ascorbate metabolism protein UlaG (beta-lactamase superfamily)